MQRPQRRRRRQRREEEVAWRGGLGRDEVIRPVAQGASAEVMVAGVGCGRKKKTLQRREKSWKEKREKVTVAVLPLVRSWVDGNDGGKSGCGGGGRWQCWLLVRRKKEKDAEEEREDLAVAVPIAGDDLGSWGG